MKHDLWINESTSLKDFCCLPSKAIPQYIFSCWMLSALPSLLALFASSLRQSCSVVTIFSARLIALEMVFLITLKHHSGIILMNHLILMNTPKKDLIDCNLRISIFLQQLQGKKEKKNTQTNKNQHFPPSLKKTPSQQTKEVWTTTGFCPLNINMDCTLDSIWQDHEWTSP